MKNLVLIVLTFLNQPSFAAIDLKPGLWSVDAKIKQEGKTVDVQAEIKKAMAKMSPEQQKQMKGMMAKMGADASSGATQVCYSKEMLQNDEAFARQGTEHCKTNFTTKTPKKIAGSFECKDGAKGDLNWNLVDSTHYNGSVKMSKDNKKTDIDYTAKFVKADCGSVKPLIPAVK